MLHADIEPFAELYIEYHFKIFNIKICSHIYYSIEQNTIDQLEFSNVSEIFLSQQKLLTSCFLHI
jgi:hypothetical protein